jgi:hypothetical protein
MDPGPRYVLTPTALKDRREPLEWELRPSDGAVTWAEAEAGAVAAGWRLPSIAELVGFLGGLPAEAAWTPAVGALFWSASGSPFAPVSRIRAVCFEQGARFVVVLLDKGERAQRWGVRTPAVAPHRCGLQRHSSRPDDEK